MPKPVYVKIPIVSSTRTLIPQLNMYGPIAQPLMVEEPIVRAMIMSGVEVYHYDLSTRMTTKLTLDNIDKFVNPETVTPAPVGDPVNVESKPGVSTLKMHSTEDAPTEETPKTEEVPQETVTTEETPATVAETEVPQDPSTSEAPTVEISETATETATEFAEKFELSYNEDGTVDESGIDWTPMTKKQKRALRARITEINEAAKVAIPTTETPADGTSEAE